MRKALWVLAAVLVLAALKLSPIRFAGAWAGDSSSPRFETVLYGAWILKALLLVHAGLAFLAARARKDERDFEPLVDGAVVANAPPGLAERTAVLAILLLATALRFHALDDQLWFDEIDTLVHYARRPLGVIVTTFDSQNQHLLYSVLARTSCVVFGEGAFALRAPAALFGVASLWALWRFARRFAPPREALFASALLAVSFHHVWFSQNARGYTGLLFLTLVGSGAFLDLLTRRSPRSFGPIVVYGAAMALATAVHVTALFVVAGHGLLWLATLVASRSRNVGANRWAPAWGFALTASLALLVYALVLPQFPATMLAKSMPEAATEWKNPLWLVTETLSGLARGVPGGWVALGAGGAVFALGFASYARQSWALVALFFLGIVVTATAILGLHHNLWPRFFFSSAGFLVLVALRGVSSSVELLARGSLARHAQRLATVAGLCVCLAGAATVSRAWGPKQDFAGALEYVRANAASGDAVATIEMTDLPYQELFHAGWATVDSLAQLEALERAHPRTWIVYCTPTFLAARQPEVWRRLQDEYSEAKVFPGTVGGSEVVVRVRR
ncbi:MAG: glycosyltransferase family 39 protein [Planctomycetes bacterium]|nr:glycosyltransferase family 39 protein [Planctomycetota bacterium]